MKEHSHGEDGCFMLLITLVGSVLVAMLLIGTMLTGTFPWEESEVRKDLEGILCGGRVVCYTPTPEALID